MTRRTRAKRRAVEDEEEDDEDALEILADVREILGHLLTIASCPTCAGTGILVERTKGEDGVEQVAARGRCPCRIEAARFVGLDDEGS